MKTLLENWNKFLNEQNISYSGVVLDEESKQKLLSLEIPEGWEQVAHHMTIMVGLKNALFPSIMESFQITQT